MDLQISDWWILRLAAMLIGLSLLCPSALALPAAGSGSLGSFKAHYQGSVSDNTTAGALASPAVDVNREQRIRKRLLSVAVCGGAILLLLAIAYVYFRLELTTRGFYSGRLQIVSVVVSLLILLAIYFLWRWLIGN